MQLTIRRENSSQFRLTLRTDGADGSPGGVLDDAVGAFGPRVQAQWARRCGIPESQIAGWLAALRDTAYVRGQKTETTHDVPGPPELQPPPPQPPFMLRVRGREQPAAQAVVIEDADPVAALRKAIVTGAAAPEPLIEWHDERLAVLDVDYHHLPLNNRPTVEQLAGLAAVTRPAPVLYHPSHGRGAKLYYVACGAFEAAELAALAGLAWVWRDGNATAEVKRAARHPHYPRPATGSVPLAPAPSPVAGLGAPVWRSPDADAPALGRFFGRAVDPEAVAESLADRGLIPGGRYAHDRCPIAPGVPSHGEPVYVGDDGIFCHSCEAKGYAWGRGRPGYVPFARLCGGGSGDVARMVSAPAHWDHARHVLAHTYRLPEPLLKLAYRAALKAKHGERNPVVPAAMRAGDRVVRLLGRWATDDARVTLSKEYTNILAALPATWDVTEEGGEYTVRVNREKIDRCKQPANLRDRGYPAVLPVHGFDVWGHRMEYRDSHVRYSVPRAEFADEFDGRRAPKYVPAARRMAVGDAKKRVEQVFPGIDWNYVYLLVATKGFADAQATQCPFLMVYGPSGSGKSTTVHVAASIVGDHATDAPWQRDATRFSAAIRQGADAGSFVVLNELFKFAEMEKIGPRQALDPLLNLTPDATGHVLYVGPVPIGRVPVVVVTDVRVEPHVAHDKQLGRRFVAVPLDGAVDWAPTLTTAGLASPKSYRLLSDDAAAACDAILSDVIDRFFSYPRPFDEVAADLGYRTVDRCDEFGDPQAMLRHFYDLVCAAPPAAGDQPTWRAVAPDDTSPLGDAWRLLADGRVGDAFYRSRRLAEADLGKVLGLDRAVKFEVYHGPKNAAFVRFRSGGSAKVPHWANGHEVRREKGG